MGDGGRYRREVGSRLPTWCNTPSEAAAAAATGLREKTSCFASQPKEEGDTAAVVVVVMVTMMAKVPLRACLGAS